MVCFLLLILVVEGGEGRGQRHQRGRKSMHRNARERHEDDEAFWEVLRMARNIYLLALAPVTLSFLYSFWKDPARNLIFQALYNKIKLRLLSNLGDHGYNTNYYSNYNKKKNADFAC